jgi:DHA1 family tetracycline resistance protein-like MFS transporter
VTPADKRAAAFGYVGAAWGVGFIVGPALGGVLGSLDMRLPFSVAAGLTLANAVYGWLVVPESLPAERRTAFRWQRANPVGALALLRGRAGLVGLVAIQVLYMLAHFSLPTVFVLYTSYRYVWGSSRVGLTLAFVGVCTAIVQGGLIGPAVRRIGERGAVLFGLGSGTLCYVLYGLAPSGSWFLAGVPFGALMGLYGAACQALMTGRVSPGEQGQLQGVNSSVMGLAGLVGPLLFGFAFARGIAPPTAGAAQFPGAPFVLAALLTAGAFLIALKAARPAGVAAG